MSYRHPLERQARLKDLAVIFGQVIEAFQRRRLEFSLTEKNLTDLTKAIKWLEGVIQAQAARNAHERTVAASLGYLEDLRFYQEATGVREVDTKQLESFKEILEAMKTHGKVKIGDLPPAEAIAQKLNAYALELFHGGKRSTSRRNIGVNLGRGKA